MDPVVIPQIAVLSGGAAVAGLAMLRRGLVGYRTAVRTAEADPSDTASRTSS